MYVFAALFLMLFAWAVCAFILAIMTRLYADARDLGLKRQAVALSCAVFLVFVLLVIFEGYIAGEVFEGLYTCR